MSDADPPDRTALGEATRRRILGDAFVDRSEAALTPLDAPFRALTTDAVWGHVWASDAIPSRERSLLTLAILATQGQTEELGLHVHACTRTGASRSDIMEVFQHVAAYAGVPAANVAIRRAREIWARIDKDPAVAE